MLVYTKPLSKVRAIAPECFASINRLLWVIGRILLHDQFVDFTHPSLSHALEPSGALRFLSSTTWTFASKVALNTAPSLILSKAVQALEWSRAFALQQFLRLLQWCWGPSRDDYIVYSIIVREKAITSREELHCITQQYAEHVLHACCVWWNVGERARNHKDPTRVSDNPDYGHNKPTSTQAKT